MAPAARTATSRVLGAPRMPAADADLDAAVDEQQDAAVLLGDGAGHVQRAGAQA